MANNTVIGSVPKGLSADLAIFLRSLREQVQIQGGKGRGNDLDRAVTFRDIQAATGSRSLNFASAKASSIGNVELYSDAFPSAPTGVEVLPTFTNVLIKWDRVPSKWYSTTEIFRVTTLLNTDDPENPYPYVEDGGSRAPFFSDAVQVASTISPFYADDLPPGTTAVYWVRHVNRDGQAGPLHSTTGSWGTTKRTPLEVLEEYSSEIYQSDAYAWLRSELGTVDALNRSMTGAGFNSGMAKLLANNADVEAIMAEQLLAASLDKHTQRFELKAQFSKNFARLSSGIHAAVNTDEAYVQRITTLESAWVHDLGGVIDAKVTTYDSALTSPTGAIATQVSALETSVGLTTSTLTETTETLAKADEALANRSTSLEAIVDVDGETITAQLETLETAIVGPTGAISSAFSNYRVDLAGSSASLTTLAEAVVTNDSNHARWGVKTDVNDKRGGVVFNNDGYMTSFLVDSDVFAITNGAVATVPFVVKNGKVVIGTALIDHADIFTLIADNITAKTIVASASISTPEISGGSITGTTLSVVGTGGKRATIDSQGFLKAEGAEFKSIVIRDSANNVMLSSGGVPSSFVSGLDTAINSKVSTVITSAYINSLYGGSAIFSGTVYAEKILGDLVDGDEINIAAFGRGSTRGPWVKVLSFNVKRNPKYATVLTVMLGNMIGYRRASSGGQTDAGSWSRCPFALGGASSIGVPYSSADIPKGSGTIQLHIWTDISGSRGYNGIDLSVPAQKAAALMYRKGSGNFIS